MIANAGSNYRWDGGRTPVGNNASSIIAFRWQKYQNTLIVCMAEYSKEKIAAQLERALTVPLRPLRFTQSHAGDKWPEGCLHVEPRLMFCIEGEVSLCTRVNNSSKIEKFALQPGEGIFGPGTGNFILECWDRPQQMLAAMFYHNLIRLIYIEHDGISPPPLPAPNPTYYYHVPQAINMVGQGILIALANAVTAASPQSSPVGTAELLKALLLNIREVMNSSRDNPTDHDRRASLLWHELYGYLIENITNPLLNREVIARQFRISASHVSRLFQQNLGTSFVEYLTSRRMEHAMVLLNDASRSISEIAEQCGYNYTSYFIQLFKRRFKMSPGEYRKSLK